MYTVEVLRLIDGLTKDRLSYFIREGYVRPKKIEVDSFLLNDFSEEDIEVIRRARRLDFRPDVRLWKASEESRR
jgi:hypothetical protein